MPRICKVLRLGLTKMFHVKHFGPVDGLRKRIFVKVRYETGILRKQTIGVGFKF